MMSKICKAIILSLVITNLNSCSQIRHKKKYLHKLIPYKHSKLNSSSKKEACLLLLKQSGLVPQSVLYDIYCVWEIMDFDTNICALVHILAQCMHESDNFKALEEYVHFALNKERFIKIFDRKLDSLDNKSRMETVSMNLLYKIYKLSDYIRDDVVLTRNDNHTLRDLDNYIKEVSNTDNISLREQEHIDVIKNLLIDFLFANLNEIEILQKELQTLEEKGSQRHRKIESLKRRINKLTENSKIRCLNIVYGMRDDLGNEKYGDGHKYRGRGFLQTTGLKNYKSTTESLNKIFNSRVLDFEKDPHKLSEHPFLSAIIYFFDREELLNNCMNFEKLESRIEISEDTIREITSKINPMLLSFDKRCEYTKMFADILSPCF